MSNPHPDPALMWQPGQSGNPNGRPKFSARAAIRDRLSAAVGEGDDLGALARKVGDKYAEAALEGNTKQLEAFDRLIQQAEGPHVQEIHAQVEATAKVIIEGWDDEEEKA